MYFTTITSLAHSLRSDYILLAKMTKSLLIVVHFLSHVQLFVTPWTVACQASLSIANTWSLSNLGPSSRWCHPTISSSVVPFFSCLQSLPASGSFLMSQFFTSGGQNIGVSASTSVLVMNIQDWFPLRLTDLISSPFSPTDSQSLLQHHSSKASILQCSTFFIVQLSYPYMTTGKTIALTRQTFVDKVISLLLNMLSRLVIAFLPRSECLLISWLQSPSVVILEPKKIKSLTVSIVPHQFAMKWWDQMPWS